VTAFSQAEIVMGVHGAGFVNMIFCQKDCRIAVVEKEFNLEFRIDHFVSTLSQACGLRHSFIVAPPQIAEGADRDYWHRHAEDVEIDPIALTEFIESNDIEAISKGLAGSHS
jgi:capsular polysaccharide biosynthesis protein